MNYYVGTTYKNTHTHIISPLNYLIILVPLLFIMEHQVLRIVCIFPGWSLVSSVREKFRTLCTTRIWISYLFFEKNLNIVSFGVALVLLVGVEFLLFAFPLLRGVGFDG